MMAFISVDLPAVAADQADLAAGGKRGGGAVENVRPPSRTVISLIVNMPRA
jgi:hypothetical protein